ncbi:MAG: hypothetical protein JWM47_3163 [Acidimicrobiales bacterium]|nr:hypothetical protein [Acidimicrobiales bacterium]
MPNDDQPLDLESKPFADDLDAPIAGPEPTPPPRTRPVVDSDWNDPQELDAHGGPLEDEWVRPAGQPNSLLLIVGGLVLLMVAVVVVLAITNNDGGSSEDPGTTLAAGPAGSDPVATPSSTIPDPGTDPQLEVPAAKIDDFKRADGPLGEFPGLGPWTDRAGSVGIIKGVARPIANDPKLNVVLSTVDAGSADVTLEVELPSPVDRSGLAFRVESPERFLAFFSTSEYGTYTLARFEDGELAEYVGNTYITGVNPGDVIGIRASGSKVDLLTNGTVRASFDDPKLDLEGTGVGVFAFLDDSGDKPVDARDFANWINFKVLPG